ncbi:DUF2127 domain-containing protein [Halomonas halocynthiae]|uniref:DUF2127 domain-containing protein n=1 Tax=Halomonas halocynthiae TaxID=176290 RepID=UPI00041AD31A|nr:DUF2127 domain-containing protein [Halomonas halocynthiae]
MESTHRNLKAIAMLEASKGVLALIVAFGIHLFADRSLLDIAEALVRHTHLNPASHFPSIFLHAASDYSNIKLSLLALGALAYSIMRLAEAYGLWKARAWAEWLSLFSGGIYIPLEIRSMMTHPTMLGVVLFLINLAVVLYMARLLMMKRRSEKMQG